MTAVVCYLENVLTPQRRIVRDVAPCSVRSLAPDWPVPFVAFLDGQPVLRADWELVIEDGQSLAFVDVRAIPQGGGGGGGGSNPLAAILMIAVMVVAPYAAAALYTAMGGTFVMAGAGMIISGMTAAIGLIGAALVSALIPPPQATSPQTATALAAASPTYNVQAQGNAARLEAAIPEHFGRMLAYPDFAAQPYQEYFDNEQYLYQLLCIGRGSYDIEAVRIEDTPVANFPEITYEVVPPGAVPALFPANVVSSVEVAGQELSVTATGPFIVSASGTRANFIGVDYVLPKGLYYAMDSGGLMEKSVVVKAIAQAVTDAGVPTGAWFDLGLETITGATTTPQRRSFRYAVAPGRYQVIVNRQDDKLVSARAGHDVMLASLRAYLQDGRSFGDVTLLALRMRATNSLSGQSSRKVNVIATRRLPVWNGSGWSAPTATRSIAWPIAYAAKQVGLSDAQIDLAGLLALDATWAARGDRFDARFDNFLSFWEAITKMAGAGRARPYLQAGVLRLFRDQAATIPVALFSMRNIVKGSLTVQYLMPTADTADAVNVGYFDEATWAPARVQAKLPGSTAARAVKVDVFGVTGRAQAFREGMKLAADNRYRRKLIAFDTEMEGFIPGMGDLVAIQHDMPAWGQGGEITAWDAATSVATLSEPPVWSAGAHYIGLRRRDGSVAGPYPAIPTAQPNQVIVSGLSGFTPYVGGAEERTHYAFGWAETWRQRARVLSVKPQGLYRVSIECINEDDNVHTAESGLVAPVAPTSQLAGYQNAPAVTGATAHPMRGNPNAMLLTWQAAPWAVSYLVEQSSDGATWTRCGDTGGTSYISPVLYGQASLFRVAAIGLAPGPWALVTPDTTPPSDVASLGYAQEPFGVRLSWPSIIDASLDAYELRVGGTGWSDAAFVASVWGTEYLWAVQAAGSRVVRVKALDTSGNYSVNAASAAGVVAGPAAPPSLRYELVGPDLVLAWGIPASGFLVDRYEVRRGVSWAAGGFIDSTKATALRVKASFSGSVLWWVCAIDAAGNMGAPANVNVTIGAPGVVTGARSEVVDNNALLYWLAPEVGAGQLPVDRYEVRKGVSWAAGSVVGSNGNSTFAVVFEQSAGAYTYWVAAVDTAGTFGAATGIAATISQPPDYLLQNNYDSPLTGTPLASVTRTVAGLYADGASYFGPFDTAQTWSTHYSANGWATPDAQVAAGYPVYATPSATSASYEEVIDYGAAIPATIITATLNTALVTGAVAVACQISWKLNAGDAWTALAAGAITALLPSFRYVKVRYAFTCAAGSNLIEVKGLNVKLAIKSRTDSGSGTAAVGGTAVAFGYPFIDCDMPMVQPGGTTPRIAVVDFTDTPNPTQFTVRIYSLAGVDVGGPFSWTVRGY